MFLRRCAIVSRCKNCDIRIPLDFLKVCLSHFVVKGQKQPFFFVTLFDYGRVRDAVLFAFSGIWKNDPKITQFKVWR